MCFIPSFLLCGDGVEVFERYESDERWNVVWRFVAGLTKFEHFQGHVKLVNKEDAVELEMRHIQYLFEAQDSTYFHSAPAPKYFEVRLHVWSPLDEYALGYCISSIATTMTWKVYFHSGAGNLSSTEYFTKPFMISNPPSVGVIEKLSFLGVRPQLCEFKHLPLQEIRVLQLSICELTNTDLLHLSELITNMPSLEELNLSHNEFTPQDDGVLKVLQQLSHSNVTTLNVENTGFYRLFQSNSTHDYPSALKSLINPSSGRLLKLFAGDNSEEDSSEEDNSEDNNSEEDNSEEDNSEDNNSEEDNSEEVNSEEDNSEEVNSEEDNSEEIDDCTFESLLFPSSLRTVTSNHVSGEDKTCTLDNPGLSPNLVTKIVKHITFQHLILGTVDMNNVKAQEGDHLMSAIADALQENTALQRVDVDIYSIWAQSLGLKIVKHNRTLQHLVLDLSFYDDDAQERDRYLSAIADALQENATLQRVEVRCSHDVSQHRAFSLDRRLVWIDSSL